MEGEENTPDSTPNGGASTTGHTEFELTFVLIMIGLLGIAFLAWYVGSGGGLIKDKAFVGNTGQVDVDVAQNLLEPDDVPGRDKEILGLAINVSTNDKFFAHPETRKTLYILISGTCEGDCLSKWQPYVGDEIVGEGPLSTIENTNTGDFQYAWNGNPLYTFEDDGPRDTLGDGYSDGWNIARP